jgi:chemotaxis protein methyltransferase CheR
MTQSSQTLDRKREFSLSDKEFKKLTGLVHSLTGIVLGNHKKDMLYGRLARRLRDLGFQSFTQYCDLLDSKKAYEETGFLVNAITTNLTKFYRESHHFDALADYSRTLSQDPARIQEKTFRVWSAGCSSGEEPYSIASLLLNRVPSICSWDSKILATDLDTNMLATGKAGVYKADVLDGVEPQFKTDLLDNCKVKAGRLQMKERARQMVHFKQLNLLHDWPMRGQFDVIFCRNVLIYFDKPTKEKLVSRYCEKLRPGGFLFLGHSESLQSPPQDLKLLGKTTYVKTGGKI